MDADRVLVVSYDAGKRNQLEGWLEAAGYEVYGCPGPGVPVICPQLHGKSCPLTGETGLVVLDLLLLGDFNKATAPGWVLLDTYLERGAHVVVLAPPAAGPPILDDLRCTLVPRDVDQRQLLATVQRALAPAGHAADRYCHDVEFRGFPVSSLASLAERS